MYSVEADATMFTSGMNYVLKNMIVRNLEVKTLCRLNIQHYNTLFKPLHEVCENAIPDLHVFSDRHLPSLNERFPGSEASIIIIE